MRCVHQGSMINQNGRSGMCTQGLGYRWHQLDLIHRFKDPSVSLLMTLLTLGLIAHTGSIDSYGAEYSQTISASNDCGNGYFATQIMCANDQSDIQGRGNIFIDTSHQTGISSSYAYDEEGSEDDESSSNGEQPLDGPNTPPGAGDNESQPPSQPTGEVAATGDPTIQVFPCCDEMPIA